MGFLETVRDILRREGMNGRANDAPGRDRHVDGQPDPITSTTPTTPRHGPAPGCWIEWESPLFGLLTGQVLDADDTHILVWHQKAEGLINIPVNWVIRTLTDSKRCLS